MYSPRVEERRVYEIFIFNKIRRADSIFSFNKKKLEKKKYEWLY